MYWCVLKMKGSSKCGYKTPKMEEQVEKNMENDMEIVLDGIM